MSSSRAKGLRNLLQSLPQNAQLHLPTYLSNSALRGSKAQLDSCITFFLLGFSCPCLVRHLDIWELNCTISTFWLYSIYCKSTIYFRRHNNIMVYLLNITITYRIILATCFDYYESSSGINFKKCCTYCFTVLCLTVFLSQ